MSKKYYAIANGRQTGIFSNWPEAQRQIQGFKGARYKGFMTRTQAEEWLASGPELSIKSTSKATSATALLHDQVDIVLYTDGGSRNHGNYRGGHVQQTDLAAWAYLIEGKTIERQYKGGAEYGATNNQMELTGLVQGLKRLIELNLQSQVILAKLDSRYILDAINKGWLAGWQRRGWLKSDGRSVANQELWQQVSELLERFADLHWQWTKGHANDPGNEFVDHYLNQKMDDLQKH